MIGLARAMLQFEFYLEMLRSPFLWKRNAVRPDNAIYADGPQRSYLIAKPIGDWRKHIETDLQL